MARIFLPIIWSQKELDALNYPDDLEVGLYVWDENQKKAILITDRSSVEIHQSCYPSSSRKRFATFSEIIKTREADTNPSLTYNTVSKWRAYKYATVIYNLPE